MRMAIATKKAPPCTLVIFGGTGDLTKRLLMPALVNLKRAGLLPEKVAVLGLGRREKSSAEFSAELADSARAIRTIDTKSSEWRWLANRLEYLSGSFDDATTYQRLAGVLDDIALRHRTGGSILFYLATAPEAFATIVENLGTSGLTNPPAGSWRRVVIEKPFGTDLKSAQALNGNQVFRIDHYLGKETVQNIMMLRFSNGIFEPLWNRDHIDHVQISVAEI